MARTRRRRCTSQYTSGEASNDGGLFAIAPVVQDEATSLGQRSNASANDPGAMKALDGRPPMPWLDLNVQADMRGRSGGRRLRTGDETDPTPPIGVEGYGNVLRTAAAQQGRRNLTGKRTRLGHDRASTGGQREQHPTQQSMREDAQSSSSHSQYRLSSRVIAILPPSAPEGPASTTAARPPSCKISRPSAPTGRQSAQPAGDVRLFVPKPRPLHGAAQA
jgi:hypothetical protein